jgi:hypothetical protein
MSDRTNNGGVPIPGENPVLAGGIYSLPALGSALGAARRFYDQMAPLAGDSKGVRVGKEALRWGSVASGALVGGAVMAVVAL